MPLTIVEQCFWRAREDRLLSVNGKDTKKAPSPSQLFAVSIMRRPTVINQAKAFWGPKAQEKMKHWTSVFHHTMFQIRVFRNYCGILCQACLGDVIVDDITRPFALCLE